MKFITLRIATSGELIDVNADLIEYVVIDGRYTSIGMRSGVTVMCLETTGEVQEKIEALNHRGFNPVTEVKKEN